MSKQPPLFSEVQGKDAILNFIFNPGSFIGISAASPPSAAAAGAGSSGAATSGAVCAETTEESRLKAEEKRAVDAAESEDLEGALAIINGVLAIQPERESALNNRAQIHRLMGNADAAIADLNSSIDLGEKWLETHREASVMEQDKIRRVLQRAYLQRSILHKDTGTEAGEAASKADIDKAAQHGSRLARMMTTEVRDHPIRSIPCICSDCMSLSVCRRIHMQRCATKQLQRC